VLGFYHLYGRTLEIGGATFEDVYRGLRACLRCLGSGR
jgi:hypothetical protein